MIERGKIIRELTQINSQIMTWQMIKEAQRQQNIASEMEIQDGRTLAPGCIIVVCGEAKGRKI